MSIYLQGTVDKKENYRRQNSYQFVSPDYIRKPFNYIDQYTNERIPYNFPPQQQRPNINKLTDKSNPTQFFSNPEYSTNDLFLVNQVANQDEAIIRQKIGNEWKIYTQTENINIDSRAREFYINDYKQYLMDDRNNVSLQGLWLSSYLFPNNFRIELNKQYDKIKTIKMTSAIFPNTRSRNAIYIDDTNNYFFIDCVMKCPWLPYNYHIDQTTNLFDFQYFSFNISDKLNKLYKFYYEIEYPYGIPRNVGDDTINNFILKKPNDEFMLSYVTYEIFPGVEDKDVIPPQYWSYDIENKHHEIKNMNIMIYNDENMEYSCTSHEITFNNKVIDCKYYLIIDVFNDQNILRSINEYEQSKRSIDELQNKYEINISCDVINPSRKPVNIKGIYSLRIHINVNEDITLKTVEKDPLNEFEQKSTEDDEIEYLKDDIIYILGGSIKDSVIVTEDEYPKVSIIFNSNTFKKLTGGIVIKYILQIEEDNQIKYSDVIPVELDFNKVNVLATQVCMVTGEIRDLYKSPGTSFIDGTFTGQVYIDKSYINFNNFIFAAMDMKWKSSNNIKDDYDILDGYSVNIIQKIQEGKSEYERFLQVEGNIKYITNSMKVLNNIHVVDNKYYGTYLQGLPSIIGNSLNNIEFYITRAINDYCTAHNINYGAFEWEYTDGILISESIKQKIEIPYGEYSLEELIDTISSQKIKVKSVKNIIKSNEKNYITNINDDSVYYFFCVVQFQCRLKVTTEYYYNSYLLKFEIDNESIEPLEEPIDLYMKYTNTYITGEFTNPETYMKEYHTATEVLEYTHTFTPSTILYDIVCCHLYDYDHISTTGLLILQDFFTLEPFYFHRNIDPNVTYFQTKKNENYHKYNYTVNVPSVIIDKSFNEVEYYPSIVHAFNRSYVFPAKCHITIKPTLENKVIIKDVIPPLPKGFSVEEKINENGELETNIVGMSDIGFQSIHYIYFEFTKYDETFKYYQQVKLINVEFKYNYSEVKLLKGYSFRGIQQLEIDTDIIASPFTNINVDIDKSWIDISNKNKSPADNVIDIGCGINIGYINGNVYGVPTSEFQMTLNITAEFNYRAFVTDDNNPANPDHNFIGELLIRPPGYDKDISLDNPYYQSTKITLYSLDADKFFGDNSFMIYSYDYVYDDTDFSPQFVCWAMPIKNEINNFISFHIFADDTISNKLLNELHFSYKNSKDVVKSRYLLDYYHPSLISANENKELPTVRSYTTNYYTNNIIEHQYNATKLLDQHVDNELDNIYPLRSGLFGYAPDFVRDLNLYKFGIDDKIFNPSENKIWYAIPGYVKNELNSFIFSQYYIDNWETEVTIDNIKYRVYYPKNSIQITTIVDTQNPLNTQYANILDFSYALNDLKTDVKIYNYCLYNRCSMTSQIIHNPINIDRKTYNEITLSDKDDDYNVMGMQIASKMNKIEPLMDKVLSKYDYYNFEDFLWISIYCDNYGEFQNIFDPLTNRWYFAKIFFKKCEKRNDISYNYFECPTYLCKNLNYIQELNSLQIKIYDKYGNLYSDYNSPKFNFSFTLEIEYFIDNIRANGESSKRPTQENVMYNEELSTLQRINNRI